MGGSQSSRAEVRGKSNSTTKCRHAINSAKNLSDFFAAHRTKRKFDPETTKRDPRVYLCERKARYEFGKTIGKGQHGVVWAGTAKDTKKPVVIKLQGKCAQFGREVLIMEDLYKTNVAARMVDAYVCPEAPKNQRYAIVMDRLVRTLWKHIQRTRRVSKKNGRIYIEMKAAIQAMERCLKIRAVLRKHKLLFHDWHLDNLMLSTDGTWKLIDFGLAAPLKKRAVLGDLGSFSMNVFTPVVYMASHGVTREQWDLLSGQYGDKSKQSLAHVNANNYAKMGAAMEQWFGSRFAIKRPTLDDPDVNLRTALQACRVNPDCQGKTSRL